MNKTIYIIRRSMKNILVAIIGLICSIQLYAQPAYDNCPAYDLGTAPFCDETVFFNNIGATTSDIGSFNIPPCFKNKDLSRDVWISFVASDTILDYIITVTGKKDGATKSMVYPEIALYRGDCLFNELAIVLCASYNPTVSDTSVVLNAFGLTPGATYFMRIHDNKGDASDNSGSFVLCVKQKDPIITITNGFSNACTGKLVDSGGDTGDYTSNEQYFYKICPAGFSQCIKFTLDYYNIDNAGDYIKIYDSDMIDASKLLATLTGANGGSGGVAYQVLASSGCVSIEFHSDEFVEEDGFLAEWQCTAAACDPPNPITIVPTATDAQIIAAVSTPLTVVTVDTIICDPGAYGTFIAPDNSLLGLKKGFLLTTGSALNAVGPNDTPAKYTGIGSPGDNDLDYLSVVQGNGTLSHDACILELDVYAAGDELSFEYIFGSEEYPEWVGTSFNDIFAFLISGPGVVGDPNIGNQKNIAILPDNTTFVQINSVNDETNWEYYRNNFGSPSIQYDGLTSDFKGIKKSLTARQKVTPCNTYHLKLAIADRQDPIYDSGVFISDIKGGAVNFDLVYNSGIDYLIEACTGTDEIKIKLSNILDYTVSYNVVITGTATNGVDYYTNVPASVTFLPGETEKSFTISPILDNFNEGTETIILTLTNNFGCGTVAYTSTKIEIHDEPYASILSDLDTVLYCKNGKINLSVKGCQTYFWQPISIMDNFESATPVATPTGDGYIYVTGQVGACAAKDSIYAKQVDPKINILTMD
ncbi:MAG TPA: choice-of-anchor L domain-containing protein, partial [Saprospiraceae bacterium]|nr:choice-of-anchor L domain-containing protein [Saprospiraceae bacterium]